MTRPRRGFTLVELLVSMTIIVILASMTIAAITVSANGDRVPGAARQTQSMILGARDRAIYAGEPRGVRLISDPDQPNLATSFVFVGAPQTYGKDRGTVSVVENPVGSGQWWIVEDNPDVSAWQRLIARNMIMPGLNPRVRVPADSTRWYTVDGVQGPDANGAMALRLSRPYTDTALAGINYSITLQPGPLPGEEPRLLPRGVAIDLLGSSVPGWWKMHPDHRDILFNERGTAYGPLASTGVLSLLIVDMADHATGFRRDDPNNVATPPDLDNDTVPDIRVGDERVLSFFASSGTIATAPVDDTDLYTNGTSPPTGPPDGVRDDPFRLAETGTEG